jgi:hypothetical protein
MVSYSRREMIAQAFCCWFESWMSSRKIYDEQSGTGARFSLSSFGFSPANRHSTIAPYLCLTAF